MPLNNSTHDLTKTSVQTLANISLFLFIFPPLGVLTSIIALVLSHRIKNQRALSTATVALSINLVALVLFYIILYFIREMSQAIS